MQKGQAKAKYQAQQAKKITKRILVPPVVKSEFVLEGTLHPFHMEERVSKSGEPYTSETWLWIEGGGDDRKMRLGADAQEAITYYAKDLASKNRTVRENAAKIIAELKAKEGQKVKNWIIATAPKTRDGEAGYSKWRLYMPREAIIPFHTALGQAIEACREELEAEAEEAEATE